MKNNPPSKISNTQSLRVLIVEDSEDDALLTIRELKKSGYNPVYERIETNAAMKKALREKQWDIILCDYKMPEFDAPSAIALLKESNIGIPLIIVSGAIGEDVAVECMRLGAHDYIMKNNLSRLCPAIARELEETDVRNKQKQAESQRNAAIEALRKSEKFFKEVTDNSSDIIIITDKNGNITYCSRSIERFTGYKPEEIIGKSGFTFIHPDDVEGVVNDFGKVIMEKDTALIPNAFRVVHKNGSEVYLAGLGRNLLDNPDIAGFVINVRDVTERKKIEEGLREEQELFRAVADYSQDIILLMNPQGINVFLNKAIKNHLEYEPDERILANGLEIVHPDDLKQITDALITLATDINSPVIKGETRLRHKDGTWRTFESVGSNLVTNNVVKTIVITHHNITERKQAESQGEAMLEALRESERRYQELSIIDDLTQLYNSRHFYAQLKKEIERSNRYEQPLTLLLLDLDKFKDFNDTYGHVEGDHVLSRIGNVIKRCLREIDSAYRYGGEEFTIMLPMTSSEEGIVTAKRIQTELRKEAFSPVLGQEVYLTISIGLAQYKPAEEVKSFVHRVDQLMYKGKKNGRNKICSDDDNVQ
jgi:diguanylate cyclase (GGDEF)-like protein/PAS domain S-box-containing protein